MTEDTSNEAVMKRIIVNQRKIMEQNEKILRHQKEAIEEERERGRISREKIPLVLKRTVRAAVKSLDKDWDFDESFRSQCNEEVNKVLLQNIKALAGMEKISHQLIEKSEAVELTQERAQKGIDISPSSHDAQKNLHHVSFTDNSSTESI